MNLRDYIEWRGDLDFDFSPFNPLDAALLSQLSLLNLDDILIKNGRQLKMTIEDAANLLDHHTKDKQRSLGIIFPDDIFEAFSLMGKSKRFKDLVLGNYINDISIHEQTQFSALTIDFEHHLRVVSFSGTDDTLIGWKENFNMLYVETTPGQHLSCAYLEKVSKKARKMYLVGHSKGGNLAIYSCLHALPKVQRKIDKVYSFDGPGLTEELDMIIDFEKNIEKIVSYVPDTSVIGRLFEHPEENKVVKSSSKGLYQHDLFSWNVKRDDFLYADSLSNESVHIENKLKDMISKLDEHTKHTFVEVGYHILTGDKVTTLTQLYKDKLRVVMDFWKVDMPTKKMFAKIFAEILTDKIIRDTLFGNIKEFAKIQKTKK